MAQYPIELILARQFASQLAMPVFIINARGTLVFFNEAAESIVGRRFDETGDVAADEWAAGFTPRDETGRAVPLETLPLMVAMRERRPGHAHLHIRGLDGVDRRIQVTAFPVIGHGDHYVGAMAIFWETPAA